MSKKNKILNKKINTLDLIGFLISLIYMQSVLTVAHHASQWIHDGSSHIVEPPSVSALIIGLSLIFYSIHKNKLSFSVLNIISITIFATASIFWLSGLRTNFYF